MCWRARGSPCPRGRWSAYDRTGHARRRYREDPRAVRCRPRARGVARGQGGGTRAWGRGAAAEAGAARRPALR
ncbi:hypothetical protein B7767_24185, partial [Streptomyces sp. 13-12-16]